MSGRTVTFKLGNMFFEYDEEKNQRNIRKHGISFKIAARVFFDYNRIEYYDEEHSVDEERYNTIGDVSIGRIEEINEGTIIGNVKAVTEDRSDILYVVYTEREWMDDGLNKKDVTRIISARMATNFERGLYYGKYD